MNVKILKRLEALETIVKKNNPGVPDMVFIIYREKTNDFIVKEDYIVYTPKGTPNGRGRRETRVINQLHDYIISSQFSGVIYFELFGLPGADNLFVISEDELKLIRREWKGDFAIESINCPDDGGIDGELMIVFGD